MTYYTAEFAAFFDLHFTGWVHDFSPRLIQHLEEQRLPERSVLDLCCGTGVTASLLLDSNWSVVGLDRSAGMLALAKEKLGPMIDSGQAELVEADARDFQLSRQVSACVCLDGALNHLNTVAELTNCFTSVSNSLLSGGEFIFDLFEISHFRHWNNVTITESSEMMIAKRGVWDDELRNGLLRVSGFIGEGANVMRVDQKLRSQDFSRDEVAAALESAGLVLAEHEFEKPYHNCRSGSCSLTPDPCRVIYRAIKH